MSYEVQIIGNLGATPEEKGQARDQQPIVSFNIAKNASYIDPKTKQRVKREPEWFQVTCFSRLAARVKASLKKGELVLVSGRLRSRTFQNAAGEKRSAFEIVAQDILRVERLSSVVGTDAGADPDTESPDDFSGFHVSDPTLEGEL